MVVTVHIADVGARRSARLLRTRLDLPGLTYSQLAGTARFGGGLLPRPQVGRVALIAGWRDDAAVDLFMSGHPVAAALSGGWHIRTRPVRVVGSWSGMPELGSHPDEMDPEEQAAVLTLGRLKLWRAVPFLRASNPAEELVARDPAAIIATGITRPPRFVATFSLWRTVREMRAYTTGRSDPAHPNAMKAHAAKPFHHEAAFVRLRPYATEGALPAGSSTTPGVPT